jgi:hypothetical protein
VNEPVRQLTAESGVLRRVAGRRLPEGYDVLELVFEQGTLRLTCDGDTDEIVVDAISQAASGLDEVGEDDSLADLLGKTIEEAWTMVNGRGYTDAFQLRCLDLSTRSASCRQFEVGASAITVSRVTT